MKYYNKPQIVDKLEKKISIDSLKFMKDLGQLFLIFAWLYLIFALIHMFLPDLSIDVFANITPFIFLISILILIILNYKKNQVLKSKKILILVGVILIAIFSVNFITTLFTLPNNIDVTSSNLNITGLYGVKIDISDINKVEYVDSISISKRISGIKTKSIIKGIFIEENLGEITAFLESEKNVVEVFLKDGRILCINFNDKKETELFFGILKLKIKN
ncbi:MAG: PH domain-containing protein [Oscillospiraceae bacterium]|nr:PH domain-containing protein [Oscillospiraceae bacterium]